MGLSQKCRQTNQSLFTALFRGTLNILLNTLNQKSHNFRLRVAINAGTSSELDLKRISKASKHIQRAKRKKEKCITVRNTHDTNLKLQRVNT